MIVAHRINTIESLDVLPMHQAIEFDVRDSNGICIVQHDPFVSGVELETFLKAAGDRFFIVNIKSEGIEERVLETLKRLGYERFFLLDCSFPKIIELTKKNEKRIAVRYSEYESIETVLKMTGKVDWVWVDCFTSFPLTKSMADLLKRAGMKICIVSPELQKRPDEIQSYVETCLEEQIRVDAVCCKFYNQPVWDAYFKGMAYLDL